MITRHPPAFWLHARTPRNRLLEKIFTPLSWLWRGVSGLRETLAHPYTASVPVICVGNVTVGGTGKTPTTLAIFNLLGAHAIAKRPCILTRGYGAVLAGPIYIPQGSTPDFFAGDEPLLMAKRAPVIISRDRVAGLKLAENMGFDCVICDDGLQNPNFTKTLSLLVVDGPAGFGNGAVIPAGPMRTPLQKALAHTHAAIMIGADTHQLTATFTGYGVAVFHAQIVAAHTQPLTGRYIAFAGIGRPQKFFDTLKSLGIDAIENLSFPDHYHFKSADCRRLVRLAERHNATLITTEKDWVRLPNDMQTLVQYVPISLQFDAPAPFAHLLQSALRKGPVP